MKKMVPSHVAIIMDGNRRWAKKRRLPPMEGHKKGTDALVSTVEAAVEFGIRYLTVYALSTENYKSRSEEEIKTLLGLIKSGLNKQLGRLKKEGVRLNCFGDLKGLPFATQKIVNYTEKELSKGGRIVVNIALNYGARDEIIQAARKLAEQNLEFKEDNFRKQLYTSGIPDPDLVIRTGGAKRLSNFLLWQVSYSEFYFTDTLWPDFDKRQLQKAIEKFRLSKRNFGR
jgi:undecaprenyl diphosphate synthase